MQVNELYKQVAELGFATSLDSDAGNRFYFAANRALLQVAALRPGVKSCVINHRPLASLIPEVEKREISEELCYESEGAKAYCFEYCGTGNAYVDYFDGEEWKLAEPIELKARGSSYVQKKGFIKINEKFFKGRVRIRFAVGDYLYSIKNLAIYQSVYSDNIEDIPGSEKCTRYNMKLLNPDFWGFCAPPVMDGDEPLKMTDGYDIEGDHILILPHKFGGTYRITYKHKPTAIVDDYSPEENEDTVDLDDDLAALLPLLIASFIWIDEEPDKAQYYLALYRENAAAIERKASHSTTAAIYTNGWA